MGKSNLKPYLRKNLDILFIGLNPAKGSDSKGHYFSVSQAFWNQLYESGLINKEVNKNYADELIFGNNIYNNNKWNYGAWDLVAGKVESNSKRVKPTKSQIQIAINWITENEPKVVILLHSKVLKYIFRFIKKPIPKSNAGFLGKIIPNCESPFYAVAFPHGNNIPSALKIQKYKEIKEHLENLRY